MPDLDNLASLASAIAPLTSAFAAVASAITAAVAVVIAVRNERKVDRRFKEDLKLQQDIAQASIAPEVALMTDSTVGDVRIWLENMGVGAARVRNLHFTKNDLNTDVLIKVLDLPGMRKWRKYWGSPSATIPPGGRVYLAVQTLDTIASTFPELDGSAREATLRACKDQLAGTKVTYQVFDIVDKKRQDGSFIISRLA